MRDMENKTTYLCKLYLNQTYGYLMGVGFIMTTKPIGNV